MLAFLSLVVGTFVSEDLACVTAGLLIQRGDISAPAGILGCTLGIFVGDVGLWAVGRLFGHAVVEWPWVGRHIQREGFAELRSWLERHAAGAIMASRVLPGSRLPLYLIAGILELPAGIFAAWALVGALLWTPALVLATTRLGDALTGQLSPQLGIGWVPHLLAALGILSLLHLLRGLDCCRDRHGRSSI
jgi:membrane protein DedA with SNARE-associated domain